MGKGRQNAGSGSGVHAVLGVPEGWRHNETADSQRESVREVWIENDSGWRSRNKLQLWWRLAFDGKDKLKDGQDRTGCVEGIYKGR